MILLLVVVGLLYSIWEKIEDAIMIFLVISILVTAEVYNEYSAKKAIVSLANAATLKARTVRDGRLSEIDAEEVMRGDLLVLMQGTRIAAYFYALHSGLGLGRHIPSLSAPGSSDTFSCGRRQVEDRTCIFQRDIY
jgi:hypothetical protein